MGESHTLGMAYSSADPFHFTRSRGNNKKAIQIGAALDRRDALLPKATSKAFMLLKEEMRPGEELGGLTPSHRV